MKTKIALTLLAFAALSTPALLAEQVLVDTDGDGFAETVIDLNTADGGPVRAPVIITDDRPICGGADDDQLRSSHARLCGGADDDQIVGGDGADFVRPIELPGVTPLPLIAPAGGTAGMTTDGGGWTLAPSSVPTNNLNNEIARIAAPTVPSMTTDGGGWTLAASPVPTNNLNNEIARIAAPTAPSMTTDGGGWTAIANTGSGDPIILPENRGIVTDPFGICDGNGNDSIVTGAGAGGGPHASGSTPDNQTVDAMILQLMTSGNLHGNDGDDTLWGGGGTDEVVLGNPAGGSI